MVQVHGEQFVIANAVRTGEQRLERITVSAAPCGHCRQFMAELPRVADLIIAVRF
jgi:cytidine deaminase